MAQRYSPLLFPSLSFYPTMLGRNGMIIVKIAALLCVLVASWSLWQRILTIRRQTEVVDNYNETIFLEDLPLTMAVVTAKGIVSYAELERKVFRPNNYLIDDPSYPIPKLRFIEKPTCAKVVSQIYQILCHPRVKKLVAYAWFKAVYTTSHPGLFENPSRMVSPDIRKQLDWLEIAKNHNRANSPPNDIEESKKAAFLLNGYAFYNSHYMNNQSLPSTLSIWNITKDMMDPSRTIKSPYGVDGLSVLHALNSYPLTGMKGIVIGSEEPWVEMYALRSGAEQLDHFGRGFFRYGDPVDPIGDLREVMKTMCVLKKQGLFFLGLPRNQDGIHYNLHRYYGRIRLAMVMTGFEWLSTFEARNSLPLRYKREDFNYRNDFTHDLFVLRKL